MARTSSIYDHFDPYLTPVTLTFNLPKNVSNGTSPPQGQQLCQIVLKSMHYCTSYDPDKSGRTHVRTHIHRTKIVTTMSSGLDKKNPSLSIIFKCLSIRLKLMKYEQQMQKLCTIACVCKGGMNGRGREGGLLLLSCSQIA